MLLRMDPFRDLDRAFGPAFSSASRPAGIAADAYRLDDEFVIEFDLPGVEADSIELTVERNVLTVEARRSRGAIDGVQYLIGERGHGTFSRRLFLGDSLDTEAIAADYVDGVLTVRLPVSDRAKPRRIEVGAGRSEPAVIEAN